MKVLVIGGGGREHAIVHTLKKSPKVDHIWCAPGNGGIAAEAECVAIKATDIDGMVAFAKEHKPDLVMVAPDDPLALGMVDALEAAGIRAFGPRKNAAIIEGSKSFAKDLMQKYSIPTAGYAVFENSADAIAYIKKNGAPIVVKADGLALGKGVTVAMTEEEAIEAVKDAIDGGAFGGAGARVVIEEFLTGPEVSVLAFVDGKHLKTMPSAQDHKRAYDHDEGPNTGGMGAFSPSRFYTDDIAAECMETIFKPTVAAMEKEGRPFKGVLYFGLMLTPKGPRVIEYNARFGDPETQAVLSRLDTDLFDIFNAVIDEKLEDIDIKWADNAACCVCMASGGYPKAYEKGKEITGLDDVTDSFVFHAGTAVKDGKLYLNGADVPVLEVPGAPDGPVWAGIRPEGFIPDETGPVACALSRVEVLGRDVSIVCTHPACQADTIRAIIPSRNLVNAADATVRFALKPDKVFLFDKADERRLPFALPGARR